MTIATPGAPATTDQLTKRRQSRTNDSARTIERPPLPQMVLTVDEAAAVAKCSRDTILRALHCTDPAAYPPPLAAAGRHGPAGAWLIWPTDLETWLRLLVRYAA